VRTAPEPAPVGIAGRGIAAATSAHCLAGRGIAVLPAGSAATRAGAPLVMLGTAAQALLSGVFAGHGALQDELAGAHPIHRRIVRWGGDRMESVPHQALVLSGGRLGDSLPWPDAAPGEPAFRLTTAAPAQATPFGQREAAASPVELTGQADRHAALVEAFGEGWLFCIPTGQGHGWLLSVGAEPGDALRESRLVAPAIAATGAVSMRFETAPRMLDDPQLEGGLVLGSGAIALDPICGDGTATAVRGGILAAAVAAEVAIGSTLDRAALCAHYRAMLIAAMRRHLTVSWPFYTRGGDSAWWRAQADAIAHGHDWCTRQLAAAGEARFVLAGDRLQPREIAA
jgi:hypothetical protein